MINNSIYTLCPLIRGGVPLTDTTTSSLTSEISILPSKRQIRHTPLPFQNIKANDTI